ncbi:MAG: GntR family transcriptional regulator, partial [Clostridiales bacterium]|nr:GntR family transcriptional regulator [Clostridiales bacterium]
MRLKSIPIYQSVFNDIYKDVLAGTYKEGELLPSENDLCVKYAASRITVQRALHMLVERGFVRRAQGRGSFVSYKKDRIAVKQRLLGVIIGDPSISFGLRLLKAVEKYARLEGYSIVYKNQEYDPALESQCIRELIA